jgi:hypothetical protein
MAVKKYQRLTQKPQIPTIPDGLNQRDPETYNVLLAMKEHLEILDSQNRTKGVSSDQLVTISVLESGIYDTNDHGGLFGLVDDDHTQYLNVTRHDADDHSGLLPIDHGSNVNGLGDDDHTQYLLADGTRNCTGSIIFENNIIATSGKLLIGNDTSRIVSDLEIEAISQIQGTSSNNAAQTITRYANTSGAASFVVLGKSRGATAGDYTIVQNGDSVGKILFAAADGVDMKNTAAQICAEVDGTPGADDTPGQLRFCTTAAGNNYASTALRLDSSQNAIFSSDLTCTSGAFTSRGIDDNASGERVQISDSTMTLGSGSDVYYMVRTSDDSLFGITGGNDSISGGGIFLYGDAHATLPGDIYLKSGGTLNNIWWWDDSAGIMRFYTGTGNPQTLALTLDANQNATFAGGIYQADNLKHFFGTGDDASIYYDGTDLIIDPQEVGTGGVKIPDADLFFTGDGSGLPYAQIYEEDGVGTLALAAQDTFYQVTSFSANGESNDATPDHTNDHITIGKAGRYLVQFWVHFEQSVGTSNVFDFHVQKNNGATDFPQTSGHRNGGTGIVGSTGGTGILDLANGDTIELWVERLDGGATSKTLTFRALSLVVTMIGGT